MRITTGGVFVFFFSFEAITFKNEMQISSADYVAIDI
jgi:hypothetical protein